MLQYMCMTREKREEKDKETEWDSKRMVEDNGFQRYYNRVMKIQLKKTFYSGL